MAALGFLKKYKIIIIGVAAVVVVAAAPSVYFFRQYQAAQLRINNPTAATNQDAKDTIAAVGKLILLPEGENPTFVQLTEADVSKLKNQTYFANAKSGDRILIYIKAKKAILYRSETNMIIDVAPVNVGSASATPSPTLNK